MKVSDVMTTEIETVQMNSTLEEVASIMKVANVGAVPVVDEDEDLVGIITDRDIVVRCVAEGKDPADTSVEEVVSHDLETIEPDADLEEAAQLMADKQIRRLPVCEDGELVGIVSIGDVAMKAREGSTGKVLREISQGVRGGGRARKTTAMPARVGGSRAAYAAVGNFRDREDLELEFSDDKDLAMSDAIERHSNRHHHASQEAKGSGNAKKKLHPISTSSSQRDLGAVGQEKQGPGNSNRQAKDQAQRNNRVVAIRNEARRRSRKTG